MLVCNHFAHLEQVHDLLRQAGFPSNSVWPKAPK